MCAREPVKRCETLTVQVLTIAVAEGQEMVADRVVRGMCSHAVLTHSVGGTVKYQLPSAALRLSSVFEGMVAAERRGLEVLDWAVSSATLEEVFIQVAQKHSRADEVEPGAAGAGPV